MTLRLRTFGSVYLSNDGVILSGAAAQRRLLAILTVLSVVGEHGISRDKLLGLLWSEGDPDKARHALTQSLYHIRKALGVDQLFVSGADIRLKPGIVASDVADFQLAVQEDRLADAVASYTGAFLDGFYLNGDPEFDFWVATERDRFARQYADTLRTLADSARRTGDAAEELRWRGALADHDPLDGAAVVQVMGCLIETGDIATALQRARFHEARMRAELDLPPDRAVVALVASLRRDRPSAAPGSSMLASDDAGEPVATPAGPDSALPTERAAAANDAAAPPAPELAATEASTATTLDRSTSPWKSRKWRGGWIGVGAAVIGVAVVARIATTHLSSERASVQASTIMVAPFRVTSMDPATAYLREGLLDLLTTRIADANSQRAADPTAVLRAWRAAGLDDDTAVSFSDASRIARDLDAGEVVVGTVESSAAEVVVHATLIDAATGRSRATANVRGSPDSLIVLTDRIVSELILTEAGDGLAVLPRSGTISPAGLRAFLAGRSAYRRADYYGAVRADEQALAHDPNFALAAFHLAIAADRANAAEQHDRGLAVAWANQATLSAADRAYLRAFAGPRYPEPSSAAEAIAAWERVVHVAPDRPEGWYELGENFYYDGEVLGMQDGAARAGKAFLQALKLDPTFAPARRMLTLLLARQKDTVPLRRLLAEQADDSADAMNVFVRWRAFNALGDRRELSRIRRSLEGASNGALRAIAMTSQFDGVSVEDGDRALEILRHRPLTDAELLDLDLARHSRALNSGDFDEALAITRAIGARQPSLHAQYRLRVLDALYSGGSRDSARAAAAQLVRYVASTGPMARADSAVRAADACVAAQWQLALADTAAARASWRVLRAGGVSRFPVLVGANPSACAELIDVSLSVAEHGVGARERLAHLDSLMLSGPTVNDAMRYANLVVAREYQAIGDRRHAVAALQRRSYMRGWPRYRATGLQLLADLSLQLGDTATARSAIARIMATRRRATVASSPPIVARLRFFSRRSVR